MLFNIKSLLWRFLFPFFKSYYDIHIASTTIEKEKVFAFRYKIYRVELQHYFLDNKTLPNGERLYDEYDLQKNSIILYSGNINNITGTIRITSWKRDELPEDILTKYHLNHDMISKFNIISEVRFFQVSSTARKSFLAISLLSTLYQIMSKRTDLAPDIIFCDCQPGLIENYFRIGAYLYTNQMIYEEFGILQIPLAIPAYDLKHLYKSQNILYCLIKHYLPPNKNRNSKLLLPHLSLYMSETQHTEFLNNIQQEELKSNYGILTSLIKNIIVLPIRKNTIIIREGIVDYDVFFLAEGTVGIFIDNILIAEITPGNLFGEMALLDQKHIRYSNVISLTDAKILLIPRNFLRKLESNNPKLATQFLRILSTNLLKKLSNTNQRFLTLLKSSKGNDKT